MSQRAISESELLRSSLAGSKDSFEVIVKRYQALICSITYSATGNPARSEELAQQAFINAWKGLAQLEDLSRFRAWLCTIARNLASKSLKKRRFDVLERAGTLDELLHTKSNHKDPAEKAINKEQQALVWQTLRKIPQAYREPMVLFYRQEKSITQVAKMLGLSEDVVKQRLSRGRKLLKSNLTSRLENVLDRTKPGEFFTAAVVAALPALGPQVISTAVLGILPKSTATTQFAWLLSWIGALLGPLLALAGLTLAIKASITNAKSTAERRFIKRSLLVMLLYYLTGITIILGLSIFCFKVIKGLLPFLFLFFILGIPVLAIFFRYRLKRIQKTRGTYLDRQHRILEMSKGSIYGAYTGSVYGTFCWLYMNANFAEDWPVLAAVTVAGVVMVVLASRLCLKSRSNFHRINSAIFLAVGLIHLLVINIRWNKWESSAKLLQMLEPWQMNLIIATVMIAVVFIGLVCDFRLQKTIKKKQA